MQNRPASRMYISVIGVGDADEETRQLAYEVGKLIAKQGAVLVCGGLGGVMDAAAQGAKEAGGLTVGLLPGRTKAEGSRFLDVVITTGLGEARNIAVVNAADGVVAIGAGYGTLSEIGFALKAGKPTVGLATWELRRKNVTDELLFVADTPAQAIDKLLGKITGWAPGKD